MAKQRKPKPKQKPEPTRGKTTKSIRRTLLILGLSIFVTLCIVGTDQARNEIHIANETSVPWSVSQITLRPPKTDENDESVEPTKPVILMENEAFPAHKDVRVPFKSLPRATFEISYAGKDWAAHHTAFLLPTWGNRISIIERGNGIHTVTPETTLLRKGVDSIRGWIPLPASLLD